jgi:predicted nucleic acid-binding protein
MAYLLDLNLLIALVNEDHIHHSSAMEWFDTPLLKWALCAFTEAGLLRFLTHPKTRNLPMDEAVAILSSLKREPGYHYLPVVADWHQLRLLSQPGCMATTKLRMRFCSVSQSARDSF